MRRTFWVKNPSKGRSYPYIFKGKYLPRDKWPSKFSKLAWTIRSMYNLEATFPGSYEEECSCIIKQACRNDMWTHTMCMYPTRGKGLAHASKQYSMMTSFSWLSIKQLHSVTYCRYSSSLSLCLLYLHLCSSLSIYKYDTCKFVISILFIFYLLFLLTSLWREIDEVISPFHLKNLFFLLLFFFSFSLFII